MPTDRKPDNPADDPGHPIQPPGQATSPDSDANAKEHQRTGETDVDPNADQKPDGSDTQRVSWTLPRSTVERVHAYAAENDMNHSDAAAALLDSLPSTVGNVHQNY